MKFYPAKDYFVSLLVYLSSLFIIILAAPVIDAAQESQEEPQGDKIINILHPPAGSVVSSELNHLVARLKNDDISYVVIRVNERLTPVIDVTTQAYRDVLKHVVIVRIFLLPGENEVEVIAKDGDGSDMERQKITVYFRDPFGNETSAIPAAYSIKPFHEEESEAPCKECHRMEVDEVVDIDPAKKNDLFCIKCHESGMMMGEYSHGTATWKCLKCHGHEVTPSYTLKDEGGKFCVDCHKKKVSYFLSMSSVHLEFKEMRCLGCHKGHNPELEDFLVKPINLLCFGCHEKVYDGMHITPGHPLEAVKDPSREGKEFNCVSCHNPHASNNVKQLRFEPGLTMCQICHSM